ncbi:MAG: acyl-CoA dehydrogenase family protein [Chloroflexi bacterium]|nr:acyl-CoA dehydrogenase family protein [Chloroflexota bacterium]
MPPAAAAGSSIRSGSSLEVNTVVIDFSLSNEQEAIRALAHEFAEREVKPRAQELDRMADPAAIFPWDIYEKGNRLGFNKTLIPARYGGLGLGEVETCLVVEELSWADGGVGSTYFVHDMQLLTLDDHGSEEQKEKWFRACAEDPEERFFMSLPWTEHGVAGDLNPRDFAAGRVNNGPILPQEWAMRQVVPPAQQREMTTVAIDDGDDWVINGTKRFITSAGRSKLLLTSARKGADSPDMGMGLFLIPADAPGVSYGHIEDKMGQRLMQNAEVIFENCRVPKADELKDYMTRPRVRGGDVEVAAVFNGISRRAYEEALAYSRIRYKGGARIVFHQAVQLAICDMAIKVLTARLLMLRAAWQNDQKAGGTAHNGMAKVYCSDVAVDVTDKAMQLFGGYGYMRDFPMEKLYRDARLGPIYHATNEMIMVGQLTPWLASMDTIY